MRSLHHPPPERTPTPTRWPHLTTRRLVLLMLIGLPAKAPGPTVDDLRREILAREIAEVGRRR